VLKFVTPDIYDDGIDAFVDGVIPILQERGLFHQDYDGTTLRDHLNVRARYGLDDRIMGSIMSVISKESLRDNAMTRTLV
jgi:hypothetical protein